ncbi:molybdopterin cofactor-binding domain-containing protein [Sphingopyxis sp. DBS4]|uniref:molybdopterin cofactor-binding domain-containing protein n=1 Tax=Sphingopyxis sp. DBS4 TaxID=2968500 RepID=UPI0035A71391
MLRVDILHDVGRSLNPAIDLGQIEGAFIQGMGWLTTEELVFADDGRLLTHAPSTYKIPTAGDRPHMDIRLWERGHNSEPTIHRSKAVGEPPFMLAISVLSALTAAVSAAAPGKGLAALDAPATPEHTWYAGRIIGLDYPVGQECRRGLGQLRDRQTGRPCRSQCPADLRRIWPDERQSDAQRADHRRIGGAPDAGRGDQRRLSQDLRRPRARRRKQGRQPRPRAR